MKILPGEPVVKYLRLQGAWYDLANAMTTPLTGEENNLNVELLLLPLSAGGTAEMNTCSFDGFSATVSFRGEPGVGVAYDLTKCGLTIYGSLPAKKKG